MCGLRANKEPDWLESGSLVNSRYCRCNQQTPSTMPASIFNLRLISCATL